MGDYDFSEIAWEYESLATVQRSASEILLSLLKIRETEDVLDLGCGTGSLTRMIRKLTKGRVVGVDPSEGMLREAVEKSGGLQIEYVMKRAEDIEWEEEFDVIVCNSALQWFEDPRRAIKNCYRALKKGGRIGVQAPAKRVYSPNFIEAIREVEKDERTRDILSHFRSPWFLLEREEEYKTLFEGCGLRVTLSKTERVVTYHTPEEVFGIFSTGAVAGYLNSRYYDVDLTEDYISAFKEIVLNAFRKQANEKGIVRLEFNRLFLVAVKS